MAANAEVIHMHIWSTRMGIKIPVIILIAWYFELIYSHVTERLSMHGVCDWYQTRNNLVVIMKMR